MDATRASSTHPAGSRTALGLAPAGRSGTGLAMAGADPVALAERRIAWLENRQRVLAQNIANADTPGYQPRDLRSFGQVLAGAAGPGLSRTDTQHLGPTRGDPDARRDRTAVERTPDGNAVSLDQQALRVAETDSAHALALGLYRRYQALMRTALGRS